MLPEDEPKYLLRQAARCRHLAASAGDQRLQFTLLGMAQEYEERAEKVRRFKDPKATGQCGPAGHAVGEKLAGPNPTMEPSG
jgi:hypothetical protein